MSERIIPDSGSGRILQKMLSIKVADWLATRVGLEISGKKEADIKVSTNSCEVFWELHFIKSTLKSPIKNASLLFGKNGILH